MPDQPAETGRAARASASTPSTRRISATRSGSAQSRWARSAVSSRPSATILACPSAEYAAGCPGSQIASPRQAASASVLSCATMSSGSAPRGRPAPRSSSRARRHSAAMSRAPNRHRGPASTRIAAAPAAGSAASRSIATTSATSGIPNSPARPTTSTANPRLLRASAMGAASALRRTSTAAVGAVPVSSTAARCSRAISSASHSRSATMSDNSAARTVPAAASGRGCSDRTATERRRASWDTSLARCSTSGGLRQLVRSSRVGAGDPSDCGKSVVNRGRLVADAPRHP